MPSIIPIWTVTAVAIVRIIPLVIRIPSVPIIAVDQIYIGVFRIVNFDTQLRIMESADTVRKLISAILIVVAHFFTLFFIVGNSIKGVLIHRINLFRGTSSIIFVNIPAFGDRDLFYTCDD
jgi:hypothetical protein